MTRIIGLLMLWAGILLLLPIAAFWLLMQMNYSALGLDPNAALQSKGVIIIGTLLIAAGACTLLATGGGKKI